MHYTTETRGKSGQWATIIPNKAQADAMRDDGFEVQEVHNSYPMWVADFGLSHVWVFFEDIWNVPSRWFRK